MVRIDRVYTRGGDGGETSLVGGARVPKHAPRIAAYGAVDELNATLGLVRTALEQSPAGEMLLPVVERVQQVLFNLGAELATPDEDRRARQPVIEPRHIEALEADIDRLSGDLPPLTSFVLPGGGWSSAHLHVARTVCRRVEREVAALAVDEPVAGAALAYLNRLSDALFVLGRWAAEREGRDEPLWDPSAT